MAAYDVFGPACEPSPDSTVLGVMRVYTHTKMAGAPTFWMSKRQDVVSLSTVEAEYITLTRGTQQAIWTFGFMSEIGYDSTQIPGCRASN